MAGSPKNVFSNSSLKNSLIFSNPKMDSNSALRGLCRGANHPLTLGKNQQCFQHELLSFLDQP